VQVEYYISHQLKTLFQTTTVTIMSETQNHKSAPECRCLQTRLSFSPQHDILKKNRDDIANWSRVIMLTITLTN